ncbi:MAG: 4-hydroxyphenylacetate 3-monooxygenase [Gammaproteobacteria bacterium]|nr:4-hydroxyphenylacetate 3-monooxygenase [Gammaproteobacteria bacterium]
MATRTGQEYLAGLKDGREVWYDGKRAEDVTTFAPMAAAVRSTAALYDLQHDPAHRDTLTVECPEFGERIARPFEIPRTREQLKAKREAYLVWARATCGMMGRSPDFLNVMMMSLAAKKSFFAEFSPARAEAVTAYYRHVASKDLFLTHALLDPQLDKGKARHQQDDPNIPLRVIDRNSEGLVVHGVKRIATAAPYADEILVWPFPPTFQPGEEPYANVFAIPMNTKGLKTLCRPSFAATQGLKADHPLSSQFDELDATVVFDHVLVPWDRVFLHEDIRFLNRMYRETRMREFTAHQTNARLEAKMGFLYALIQRMTEVSGYAQKSDMMEMLGEAVACLEVIRSTTRSAEEQATVDPENNVLYPDLFALQAGRALGPVYYPKLVNMLRKVGGGGLIQLPVSLSEFSSPIGLELEQSLRGAGTSGQDKARLFKLAWDVCGSEFGARHELYEMNYAGERGALLAGLQREYGRKQFYTDQLDRFMETV